MTFPPELVFPPTPFDLMARMARAVSDTSVELVVIEDGWVSEAKPGTNYNRKGLGIGCWKYLNRSMLKFDLDIDVDPEEISSVELLLFGGKPTDLKDVPAICEVHYTINPWHEEDVTWNNQPPPTSYEDLGSLMGSTTETPRDEAWFSIPLNIEFVKHRLGRRLNMILKGQEGTEDSYFYAKDKEGEQGAYAAKIIIQIGPPTPPPPDEEELPRPPCIIGIEPWCEEGWRLPCILGIEPWCSSHSTR